MKILITGGAGYIGSHTAKTLANAGHEPIIYDNLSTGPSEALHKGIRFIMGDVRDATPLGRIMKDTKIEAVIHLAGKLNPQESLKNPLDYYDNNVIGTYSVVKAMVASDVKNLVFSSSASVYGDGDGEISEEALKNPLTPYAQSKLISEQIIKDAHRAYGLHYAILRYFNVAGAADDGSNGQRTAEAFHLVHLSAKAALNKVDGLKIFSDDFNTPDGTSVRDYIHVEDLADINLKALEALAQNQNSTEYNCGCGRGYSVKQVVEMMQKVSGVNFKTTIVERQPSTPTSLIANIQKIKNQLKWQPTRESLELICKSAFEWEKSISK